MRAVEKRSGFASDPEVNRASDPEVNWTAAKLLDMQQEAARIQP